MRRIRYRSFSSLTEPPSLFRERDGFLRIGMFGAVEERERECSRFQDVMYRLDGNLLHVHNVSVFVKDENATLSTRITFSPAY